MIWIILLISSVFAAVMYGKKAKDSLDSDTIYPPQMFWQAVFNYIPSRLNYTKIAKYNFLVLKMDNTEGVNNISKKIETSYKENKNVDVRIESATFDEKEGVYTDCPKLNKGKEEEECGIIFLVGNGCKSREKQVISVMDNYAKDLPLPMAYISSGSYEFNGIAKKYCRINDTDSEKCANHLIMRSYRRSEQWVKLCSYMHKLLQGGVFMIVLGSIFAISIIPVLKSKYEQSKSKLEYKQLEPSYEKQIDFIDSTKFRLVRDKIKKCLTTEATEYFFSDISTTDVKIWLNDKNNKKMVCVYCLGNEDKENEKSYESIVGGVANFVMTKKTPLYLLWPKKGNNSWENQCGLAWDKSDNSYSTEYGKNYIKIDGEIIKWQKGDPNDDDKVIFCYASDGPMVLELDFKSTSTDDDRLLTYITNHSFRDQVKRFSFIVESVIAGIIGIDNKEMQGKEYSTEVNGNMQKQDKLPN